MRKILMTTAAILTMVIAAAPALRAEGTPPTRGSASQPDPMGHGGMQGGNMPTRGMMKQTTEMMTGCNKMMQSMNEHQMPQHPNERPAPQTPHGSSG